jgi:hypothetical protein
VISALYWSHFSARKQHELRGRKTGATKVKMEGGGGRKERTKSGFWLELALASPNFRSVMVMLPCNRTPRILRHGKQRPPKGIAKKKERNGKEKIASWASGFTNSRVFGSGFLKFL